MLAPDEKAGAGAPALPIRNSIIAHFEDTFVHFTLHVSTATQEWR
jgi:hypothetical protein